MRSIHEAHELSEHEPRRHDLQWVVVESGVGARNIERFVHRAAGRIFAPANGKCIIADSHFHVVRLSGEDSDRSVLCLPPKTADGAIVGHKVGVTGNSEFLLLLAMGGHVGENRRVLDAFNQSQSKKLQRDAECDIAIAHSFCEVRLLQCAAGRIRAALQGEEAMHAAIASAVRVVLETDFTERTVGSFELGHGIGSTQAMSNFVGWIVRRGTSADGRLRVASETLIRVENRTHAGGVHQGCWRERIVGVRIGGQSVLRLLRAGVARAF